MLLLPVAVNPKRPLVGRILPPMKWTTARRITKDQVCAGSKVLRRARHWCSTVWHRCRWSLQFRARQMAGL